MAPHESAAGDAFMERLCLLLLDIIKDPQGASQLALAGVAMALCLGCGARARVFMSLIKAEVFKHFIEALQEISPVDWASWASWGAGVLAGSIFTLGWTMSTVQLPTNKTTLMLESGFVDSTISLFKAFELNGVGRLHFANRGGIWSAIMMLTGLDLTADEARPIVKLLEDNASVWRFILGNDAEMHSDFGWGTAAQGSLVYALAFGREESSECSSPHEPDAWLLTQNADEPTFSRRYLHAGDVQ